MNIKEAMADSTWIESMQEELHQFDRLDVWELVDRPLCKNVINLKWLCKNKREEENTVIRKNSCLVAKGYAQMEGIDFEESFAPVLVGAETPVHVATKHLIADLSGTPVDQTKYRSMVGALMYLIASRPDIVHATCYCARYQAKPTEKHLTAVKWIFRFGSRGLSRSRKSTSGGIQFLGGDKLSLVTKKQTTLQCLPAESQSMCPFICVQRTSSMIELSSQIMAFTLIKYLCYCDSKGSHSPLVQSSAFLYQARSMSDITS
ncbi:retrovirus-related pol polyprotein from transposon TNT 1-94 [Tanacetum coccineum]